MRNAVKFISAPYVIDRKLYKYYSNVGYAIDSLKKGRIHLDNPQKFNDPWTLTYLERTSETLPMPLVFKPLPATPTNDSNPTQKA